MSTQSSKVEVLWSPNKDDDFAVYGTELKLYSVQEWKVRVCVVCVSLATPTSMERERIWYLTAALVECNQHMPLCTWLVGEQIMH